MKKLVILTLLFGMSTMAYAQNQQAQIDSLKREILQIRADIEEVDLNLQYSRDKFKKGIVVATIGYAVTIAGGLMLGRENDDLGKGLLIAGGATGITGTVMMVDAFNYLSGKKKKR